MDNIIAMRFSPKLNDIRNNITRESNTPRATEEVSVLRVWLAGGGIAETTKKQVGDGRCNGYLCLG